MNSSLAFQSHREVIAGIPCDFLLYEQYQEAIHASLQSKNLTHIITLNAEMVVAAQRDSKFREAIESAQLIIPDSAGIVWAQEYAHKKTSLLSFLFSKAKPITGVDSIFTICEAVEKQHGAIYLLGGEENDRKKTAKIIQQQYPGLKTIQLLISSEPSFARMRNAAIFVALGAPKQTLWIETHRTQLEQAGIRVAIGVGGAFAMISGRLPRAPHWVRAAHLEWAWRLMLEPSRTKRIWNAVVVFPRLIFGYPH